MTTTRIVAGTAALVVMAMQSPLAYAGGHADQTAQTGQVAAIEQPVQAGLLPEAPAASAPAVEAPATEVAQAVPVAPPETAAPQAASRAKASADNGSIQEVIVMGKAVIDPTLAATIAMESAIPMSKADLAAA